MGIKNLPFGYFHIFASKHFAGKYICFLVHLFDISLSHTHINQAPPLLSLRHTNRKFFLSIFFFHGFFFEFSGDAELY